MVSHTMFRMRAKLVNLFALIIVITSIGFSLPQGSFEQSSDYLVSTYTLDSWEADSLNTPTQKNSENVSVIAQDFIPIVLISDFSQPQAKFDHYLPLYSQERQKEYFLLI